VRICIALKPLYKSAPGPGKYIPIDKTRIIAFRVSSVFREFLAKAEFWRPVQSNHRAFDDRPCDKVQVLQTRKNFREQ